MLGMGDFDMLDQQNAHRPLLDLERISGLERLIRAIALHLNYIVCGAVNVDNCIRG